ncbi:cilia- and flagella-associated protein 70 isoform X3 [Amia ocellicauda]|uniref:cilia- and flagella-associated protein 70 isoform X3 n=1 Tax=Amia ocellicauda TaxID=2972642 RepID=UPI003463F7E9
MSENDCLRSELKSRCGRPGPGRDLAITRCNYGNGRRRQFNNFKTQNPGRRANTPTTLTAFQMEPSQAAGAAVPVQITVLRGRNLKGTKGESCLTFIRAEFNGVVLGDSQKLEASADQGVEYNFPCSFECAEGSNTLDDLAHKPVVLTLYETLPKEKKQKDEKTLVLGQAIVGLLPLLQGQNTFSITAPLQAAPGSPGDGGVLEGSDKPSLDVAICVPEALLSEAQLADSNLLKVAVEAAYSVPEAWATTGPPFNYVAAMQVPLTAEREQLLAFSGGALKPGGEREPVPRPKKWPVGPSLTPGAQYIPGALIEGQPIEGENGELTGLEDRDFRVEAESIQKRVIWDTERCCFLEGGALGRLAKRIADCRFWPVEIMRAQVNTGKAVKAGKDRGGEDDAQLSFHGVAYVDMAPLLYPGVKRIRGAYQILPFYEADLLAKTKRQGSVLRDSLRQTGASGKVRVPSSLGSPHLKGAPSKILKDDKGAKEASKKASAERVAQKPQVSDSVAEVDVGVPLNTEGQMYAEARTYIVIEIALDRPLVPKRLPEELAKRVAELIPPRPPLPRRPAGAERAVRDFHGQVANVTGLLLDQYHELFGAATARGELPLDVCAQEERKTRLLGELNYSGKYFAFKEQMKHSVVRIVREKMLRTEAFAEPEELQAFLSQLYIFLVDEMHVSLNKSQSKDVQDTEPQPYLDSAQLRHFAREAQMNEDFQLAAQYYQEMAQRALAQELLCPDGGPSSCYHLALARLHLQRAEYDQAEGSLKTALQDSFENPDAWALSGHVHYLTGGLDAARQCYERTLDFTKDASEMHPVYLRLGNIYLQEQQFGKAKLTYLRACKKSPSCLSWLGLGTACYRLGELTEAEDALTEANTLNNANPEVWGYLSLVCLQTGRRLEAEQAYKYAVKLNLQKGTLLQEIHQLQQRVGFGNPSF